MINPANEKYSPEGFILVGGASSRFGYDKAQAMLGGKKMYEIAVGKLNAICDEKVSLIGGEKGSYPQHRSIKVLPDLALDPRTSKKASIAGLYTALVVATAPWIIILACDLPFISPALLQVMSGYCSDDIDAVVPIQPDAKPQPLCAFYRPERCREIVRGMLRAGDWKLQNFLSLISAKYVLFSEIAQLEGSTHFFLNINDLRDYENAKKILAL